MCCEDVQIMRRSKGALQNVTVDTSSTRIVGVDKDRSVLVLFAPSANTVWLSPQATTATGEGVRLVAGDAPVILKFTDVGDLVTREWSAIADVEQSVSIYAASYDEEQCRDEG